MSRNKFDSGWSGLPRQERPENVRHVNAFAVARGQGTGSARARQRQEEDLQRAVAQWLRIQHKSLVWFHVPNGGARNAGEAGRLKAMGVRPGVADLCFVLFGLTAWIELKSASGAPTAEQLAFRDEVQARGQEWHTARTLEEVMSIVAGWQRRGLMAPRPPEPTRDKGAVDVEVLDALMGRDALDAAEKMEGSLGLVRFNRDLAAVWEAKGEFHTAEHHRATERMHARNAEEASARLMGILVDGASVRRLGDGRLLFLVRATGKGRAASVRRDRRTE